MTQQAYFFGSFPIVFMNNITDYIILGLGKRAHKQSSAPFHQ